jgi:hypothetical protein
LPKLNIKRNLRERSRHKKDFVCFYEHDINFREILTNTVFSVNKHVRVCMANLPWQSCLQISRNILTDKSVATAIDLR